MFILFEFYELMKIVFFNRYYWVERYFVLSNKEKYISSVTFLLIRLSYRWNYQDFVVKFIALVNLISLLYAHRLNDSILK